MVDVAPELIDLIKKEFEKEYKNNTKIKELLKKIADGSATYEEANLYAGEVGECLASVYDKCLSSEVLPDGKMYFNIAERVLGETLREDYKRVADYSEKVQKQLNEKARIGLNPVIPGINEDRVSGIINKVSTADNFDKVKWVLQEPIINFSQSIVDEFIQKNADFHYKSGMTAKIERKLAGGCCDWCARLAGTYNYKDAPKDIYRRHAYCRCIVIYNPGNGKYQDVHSKKWWDREEYIKKSKELEQYYVPVIRGKEKTIISKSMGEIVVNKIDGYDDIYIAQDVSIKPKAIHNIQVNVDKAINLYGGDIENKPQIIIVNKEYIGEALGKYDCVQNIVYFIPEIGDKTKLVDFIETDSGIIFGSTEKHEMWHWMQAQQFGKPITDENKSTEYFPWLLEKAKKNIDALGINEYNVSRISEYAEDAYFAGRYDDAEAEYYALVYKKRR